MPHLAEGLACHVDRRNDLQIKFSLWHSVSVAQSLCSMLHAARQIPPARQNPRIGGLWQASLGWMHGRLNSVCGRSFLDIPDVQTYEVYGQHHEWHAGVLKAEGHNVLTGFYR